MPDLAGAYAQTRATMITLTSDLSPTDLENIVPACPAWTVKDLVAHVTSLAAALSDGEFPPDLNPSLFWDEKMAAERDVWVDRGLEARRDNSIDEIIAEWEASATNLEAMMRGEAPWPPAAPPLPEWIVTTDLAVHHHDLRGALGQPGERDSLATGLSLRSYVEAMRFRAMIEQSPSFRIVAGSRDWVVGAGDPVATLTADPFELARAASGRRSTEQLRALDWQGDAEPFLHFFYPYGERETALVE